MQNLDEQARGYFMAGGFKAQRAEAGFFDFERISQRVLLWVDNAVLPPSDKLTAVERAGREARERELVASFEREMRAAAGATGYFLIGRTRGLSQAFTREAAARLGPHGGIRVPIQLFDTAYKSKGASGSESATYSAFRHLAGRAGQFRRVAQPFFTRRGLAPDARQPGKGDLVEHLDTALKDPPRAPKIRFIDGSAGSGKTVAFNALVAALGEEFIAAKQAHHRALRPIPFLPEHLRGAGRIGYVKDLVGAVAEADMAEAVTLDQLKWLLINGYSTWMFDGLDEFYAGSPDFISFLQEVLTAPGSVAQILIATRDSLLTSSAALRRFIEQRLAAGSDIEIYELAPWGPGSWQEIAWLELEHGRSGAERSPRVAGFVAALQQSADIAALAALPFYCSVLLRHFRRLGGVVGGKPGILSGLRRIVGDEPQPLKDEFDVMQLIIDQMIDREHGKEIFQWQDFFDLEALLDEIEVDPATAEALQSGGISEGQSERARAASARLLDKAGREGLVELLESMAFLHRRAPAGQSGAGLSSDEIREVVAPIYLAAGIDKTDEQRLLTVVVQFAFFGAGRRAGTVDFTHPILADYLAGRYTVSMLAAASERPTTAFSRPEGAVRQAIGTVPVEPGAVFHRYLARELGANPKLAAFLRSVHEGGNIGDASVAAFLDLLFAPKS